MDSTLPIPGSLWCVVSQETSHELENDGVSHNFPEDVVGVFVAKGSVRLSSIRSVTDVSNGNGLARE